MKDGESSVLLRTTAEEKREDYALEARDLLVLIS